MSDYLTQNKDYIFRASDDEKVAFITILCTLANTDGKIKPEEVHFIEELAENMEVEILPQFFKYTEELCIENAVKIKTRRLALELIKNMFALAYTDNDFSDSEGHFICAVGEALGVEPQKIGEISSWIIDRIIWLEQGALIFEENNI